MPQSPALAGLCPFDTVIFMQAVILAAGRGSRMGHLTDSTPKALLQVAGRTLLEYKLDALPDDVEEVIIVVGYLGSVIHDRFGPDYFGKRLLYVEEEELRGTAAALWNAKDVLKDRFFVMNGDNLYAREDMLECGKYDWSVLVSKVPAVRTGSVEFDAHFRVTALRENTDHAGGAGWANTGLYTLDKRIFEYEPVPKSDGARELGLPQTIVQAAKNISIRAVPTDLWLEIKSPEDLRRAEEMLAK